MAAVTLYMHYRAGEGPGDTRHSLDLRDYQAAKIVDIVRLGPDDHVVGAGDVFRLSDAVDLADAQSYIGSLPDLRLDENVRMHHVAPPHRGCDGNATVGALTSSVARAMKYAGG